MILSVESTRKEGEAAGKGDSREGKIESGHDK